MAALARWLLDRRDSCVRALRNTDDDPSLEQPSVQNCWSYAIKKWLTRGGKLIISRSPRARIIRCEWQDRDGRVWHFEPLKPKRGIKAIWHAYLHKGVPKRMR